MRRSLFNPAEQVFWARVHEGNRGWMTLFQDWAEAWNTNVSFVEAFETKIRLHSWKFREFCAETLDLPVD